MLKLIGKDFRPERRAERWALVADGGVIDDLPLPALVGEFQLANAATAIMALKSLSALPVPDASIRRGLLEARLPGRFQKIMDRPEVIVDVAHNAQAASALAAQLKARNGARRTCAVVAMLADKPAADVIEQVSSEIDCWYTAGLDSVSRGLPAQDMAAVVERSASDVKLIAAPTVATACEQALTAADKQDRIIIFGSFYTVAEAMRFFASRIQ